jgi:hypothetical protein
MSGISELLSWQFLLFALGIFVPVWIIRKITEYFIPSASGNKLWEKLILPLMPIVVGSIVSYFATAYAYPLGLTSTSGRLMFGSVAGLLSGLIYQVINGMLKSTIQTYISNITTSVITTTPSPINPPVFDPSTNTIVTPAVPQPTTVNVSTSTTNTPVVTQPIVNTVTTSTSTTSTSVEAPGQEGMNKNNGPTPGQA